MYITSSHDFYLDQVSKALKAGDYAAVAAIVNKLKAEIAAIEHYRTVVNLNRYAQIQHTHYDGGWHGYGIIRSRRAQPYRSYGYRTGKPVTASSRKRIERLISRAGWIGEDWVEDGFNGYGHTQDMHDRVIFIPRKDYDAISSVCLETNSTEWARAGYLTLPDETDDSTTDIPF